MSQLIVSVFTKILQKLSTLEISKLGYMLLNIILYQVKLISCL